MILVTTIPFGEFQDLTLDLPISGRRLEIFLEQFKNEIEKKMSKFSVLY